MYGGLIASNFQVLSVVLRSTIIQETENGVGDEEGIISIYPISVRIGVH
jgi:hypothetical protein